MRPKKSTNTTITSMNPHEEYLSQKLHERSLQGNLRSLTTHRQGIDFFTNDYLGFATQGMAAGMPEIAAQTGSTGSRLLSGNSKLAMQLEEQIAAFHDTEAALLFNSGYDANTGLIAAVTNRHSVILYDELCHASIIDGVCLSQSGNTFKFRHNDTLQLADLLQRHSNKGQVFVITESIYSMDGDEAPLEQIAQLCGQYNALLIVDEAHAIGTTGPYGKGLVAQLNLTAKVWARVHTFGKAMGCHGAAVTGSLILKNYLINFCRPFIYTTALPPQSLIAIQRAYNKLAANQNMNTGLHEMISCFRNNRITPPGMYWTDSRSPIQALITGSNQAATALAAYLAIKGFDVRAIRSPTVPEGRERLRFCLHTYNKVEEIERMMYEIGHYISASGLINGQAFVN